MAFIPYIIMAASAAFEGYEEYSSAQSAEAANQEEATTSKLEATQQSLQRMNKINQVLGTQTNIAASSGLAATSPSFKAIQQDSIKQFAQDQSAANMEQSLKQQYFSSKSDEIESNLWASEAKTFSTSLIGAMSYSKL